MLISDCCGAPAKGISDDIGICPDCREHCDYIDTDEEEEDITDSKKATK